jgi:hypothetical protein
MLMSEQDCQSALVLFSEMMDMTQQVVAVSSEPDTDLPRLIKALELRMSALKTILQVPETVDQLGAVDDKGRRTSMVFQEFVAGMKALSFCVDKCVQVLTRQKMRVEQELVSVRQSQKALQAYGARSISSARRRPHSLKNYAS